MPTEENKPVEEPKKDELPQTPSEPSAPTAEPKKDEAPVAEPKADGCGGDATAKLADALDAISKKLDALLEAKAEPKKDEPSVAEPNKDEAPAEPSAEKTEGVGDSMPSLPQYTQSLGAIEKGYNLDDAFNRLKGRR
jgi:hypothetical protein